MGNCGTREESAVVSNAQVQQQLHHMLSSSSVGVKNGPSEKKHSQPVSDLNDPSSTPRNFEDSRKNAVLYTHVIAFSLYELETITKSFRSDYILGEGGFGTVYKGYIDENVRVGLKSLPVAVKVLTRRVFRATANGLLSEATVPLPWATRMMIALGAAKGLAFLHNAERPVIYRDFKTSNILLDSDYTAKLSDFGLAKAGPQGHLTARSDVYSFGVVLLELLTGRKSVDKTRPSKEQSLVDWARPKLNDKRKLLQIIDPRLENQYSVRAALKACSLAYYCLSLNPKARPLMSDVVETLEPLQCNNDGSTEVLSTPTLAGGAGAFTMGMSLIIECVVDFPTMLVLVQVVGHLILIAPQVVLQHVGLDEQCHHYVLGALFLHQLSLGMTNLIVKA
ncbi:hypothetical protein GH714_019496 [Hevea brasiliensis]|uniref:Protein kinase domain-containing protein n=1 Tax=Hevea brasiliensis TaxID=3981 RepID=A0A6A6M185_HEVBR|nr:hypothetical protein GH714_019496 [Hevea brasiliensis]